MSQPKSILITGASSGIGKALALEYADSAVALALCGRDQNRLNDIAEQCRLRGALVDAQILDVTDQAALQSWITDFDQKHPLDLVIANAGISGGSGNLGETENKARAIFDVNVTGVLNTIWPAINVMRLRHQGHIVLVSSIAGMAPLPGAPAYSASKAAVKAYGEALNGALKPEGLTVTTICPGFVESRITAKNTFTMPFLMSAEKAATIIHQGLDRGYARQRISLIFPWPMATITWIISNLPPCVRRWVMLKAPKKD